MRDLSRELRQRHYLRLDLSQTIAAVITSMPRVIPTRRPTRNDRQSTPAHCAF
jgi:hypothetical protein